MWYFWANPNFGRNMFEEITLKTPGNPAQFLKDIEVDKSVKILNNKDLITFVESISQMVLIINRQREIVYANKSFHDFFGTKDIRHVVGKKPGDSFKCKNVAMAELGCGSSRYCRSCGAANAIIEASKGIRSTKECNILTTANEAIDLRVTTSPITLGDTGLTLLSIFDISEEKRRISLERIFIHDILNIAGGINGLSAILKEIDNPNDMQQIADTIENASNNLIDEIQTQREFSSAERGDLTLHYTEEQSLKILIELKKRYSNHLLNHNTPISVKSTKNFSLVTDKVLLKRILGNMIKNAIEANEPNDQISISCVGNEETVCFEVHNKSVISEEIQAELFRRFFSTKQKGRGIGTYSMKLFGEKYLKGKVWYTSSEDKGTSFFFKVKA